MSNQSPMELAVQRIKDAGGKLVRGKWEVEVEGDLDLSYLNLTKLPPMRKVGGDFYCSYNQLTSLEGAPEKVDGSFSCSYNQLTSLEGAPEKVGGSFFCNYNQLTSLEGAPEKVGGDFSCHRNQLTSLEGAPEKVGENFYCDNNPLPEGTVYKPGVKAAKVPPDAPPEPVETPPPARASLGVRLFGAAGRFLGFRASERR